MPISARSISLRAADILSPGVNGRVLASFARVCNLVTDDGAVVALVWGGVGDGPLNVVLARKPGAALPAGVRFTVEGRGEAPPAGPLTAMHPAPGERRLSFSGPGGNASSVQIGLSAARSWNPRPDWEALRPRLDRIGAAAADLNKAVAADIAPYLKEDPASASSPNGSSLAAVGRAGRAVLRAHRDGDQAALAHAVSELCGLGPGLTPAGDDWLAGWLLALHLACPAAESRSSPRDACLHRLSPAGAGRPRNGRRDFETPDSRAEPGLEDLADLVTGIAGRRTTTLSRAFLECAAAGEADADWHRLLAALAGGSPPGEALGCARAILAHGSTSGAAMLAGFLAGVQEAQLLNPPTTSPPGI